MVVKPENYDVKIVELTPMLTNTYSWCELNVYILRLLVS